MALEIVIIDDDDDDIFLLSEALRTLDGEVNIHAFSDSEDACSHLFADKINRPDFVFIDINMPKILGPKCLEMVRANRDFDRSIVVMISTSMVEKDVIKLTGNGADFAVAKPPSFSAYKSMLLKILTRQPD